MKTFAQRLKQLREEKELSQRELAKLINIAHSTLGMYEIGEREPDFNTVSRLAAFFNTSVDYLLGRTDDPRPIEKIAEAWPVEKMVSVPVYGEVRAGDLMFAQEEILGYEFLPAEDVQGGEYFFLKVKGDSMINARICEGDFVLVRKQPVLENGKIGVVLIGEEATIKRFYKQGDLAILKPENPAYEPIVVPLRDVVIIGEIVEAKIKFS